VPEGEPSPPVEPPAPYWEYKVIRTGFSNRLEYLLNQLGAERWELVSIAGMDAVINLTGNKLYAVLKRPYTERRTRQPLPRSSGQSARPLPVDPKLDPIPEDNPFHSVALEFGNDTFRRVWAEVVELGDVPGDLDTLVRKACQRVNDGSPPGQAVRAVASELIGEEDGFG
jgi:hypothetical protein